MERNNLFPDDAFGVLMQKQVRESGNINPMNHLDTPLWCIHGSNAFPNILCFKLLKGFPDVVNIWGYSIHQNQPGFRTLGISFYDWIDGGENHKFFLKPEDALEYLKTIITPK